MLQRTLNHYGQNRIPFFFVIDYKQQQYDVVPLDQMPEDISFSLHAASESAKAQDLRITKRAPIDQQRYRAAFEKCQKYIAAGETYLLNLTFPTAIELNTDHLFALYQQTQAPYKLYYRDRFICFSPETFVQIRNNRISTFPMKGTARANHPEAEEQLLQNSKELAEHTMVVDLLRNDLSMVARKVRVKRFRYAEKTTTGQGQYLWQTSSEICGELDIDWKDRIGDILMTLLPAGSITGTPKKRTCEIIASVERYDRGFFTGIFGVFDGSSLDSAVMIRFIERQNDQFIFKSGGGITCESNWQDEYEELCEKIYLPIL